MNLPWRLSDTRERKGQVYEVWNATPYSYHYQVARSVGGTYFFKHPQIRFGVGRHRFTWNDDMLAAMCRHERRSESIWEDIMKPANLIYLGNMPTNICHDIEHGKAICDLHWEHFQRHHEQDVRACCGCHSLMPKGQGNSCGECLKLYKRLKAEYNDTENGDTRK